MLGESNAQRSKKLSRKPYVLRCARRVSSKEHGDDEGNGVDEDVDDDGESVDGSEVNCDRRN